MQYRDEMVMIKSLVFVEIGGIKLPKSVEIVGINEF